MTIELALYVKHTNKRDILDLIRDSTLTIKITNRKIACVLLNWRKGAFLCDITKVILHEIHFTILVTDCSTNHLTLKERSFICFS